MYKTAFQLAWPYLRGYMAKRAAEYAADYLQKRREQRLKKLSQAEEEPAVTCPPGHFSMANAVWYTMSGVLLGSALGIMLAQIFRSED